MAIGKNIKGITIEFDGDTTKLGRAISKIDKETKSLDSQLKQVNRALKFNPGNTELLAQKQQILGQKIGQTKERLDKLKAAQAKLDDDPAVDKTSQDYMELRREIIETESKLKHFERQLKDLENVKFEKLGKSVEGVGNKMKGVGDGMTKYVTGPIVGVGAAAMVAFKEVDEGLDIIIQKTGATGKALEGMKKSALELAQNLPTDFQTAGSAIGEVNTRFGVTGKELETLSGQFIKFAKLNGTDVSTSIDSVQKAMAAYGLDASQASAYLDVLNKAGQDTGVSMDQLSGSLVDNAAALQAMGMDANQSAFFVAQLEKSGVDSSAALGGLQKALVNGAKEGKTMEEVLAEVQSSVVGAATDTDALAAATEIFGAKAAPKMANALRSGALDLQALSTSATDATNSVDKTFEETLDPMDKWQMAMNSLKVTGYEVGATVLTSLIPTIEKLGAFIQRMAEGWANLSPGMQSFILKAAGLVAIIGPILSVIGRLTIGLGGLITMAPKIAAGFGMISKAFTAMKAALLANPWVLVAAAAIAAIVLIYKNWDKIKAFFVKLWDAIKAGAKKFKDGFVNIFKAIGETIKTIVSTWFKIITWPYRKAWELIKKIAEKIKNVFDFKFKLPKIKLPHFKIQPPGWKLSDLLQGDIPSLGVDWYAKGGIFRSPSVIGVGERGPEAVLPIDRLNGMMVGMADSIVNGILSGMALQGAGAGGEITIPIYLYPSGPKMGEETVRMYDQYKRILG